MASFGCGAWAQELLDAEKLREVEAHAPAKVEEQFDPMEDESDPIGPGWFDSSWELRRGLIVREGLPVDAKLEEWLGIELIGAAEEMEFA